MMLGTEFDPLRVVNKHNNIKNQLQVVNVMEAFLEVLGRLIISHPTAFPQLIAATMVPPQLQPGQPQPPPTVSPEQAQAHFIERWLNVAGTRFVEEMMGIKTMAMLGRFRCGLEGFLFFSFVEACLRRQLDLPFCICHLRAGRPPSSFA